MQKCWHKNCEFDGITEIYNGLVDRVYPVCYRHFIGELQIREKVELSA